MGALEFVPLVLSTLGLAFAPFARNKKWIIVAFVIWLSWFVRMLLTK